MPRQRTAGWGQGEGEGGTDSGWKHFGKPLELLELLEAAGTGSHREAEAWGLELMRVTARGTTNSRVTRDTHYSRAAQPPSRPPRRGFQ